ncbi:hypothetical protein Ahy_B03g061772 [Arachis hypogaea]|uniref:Replication protein A 70 kDa DNA-binding subunit B/D first OB fold domain-containing protein n=1 Tax=Arachis hypogaea TaxID=3818 RepID=A0A444ZRW7_ARAHY|nr:hypothetical protein Ahy_B03g061772 [Arachis hypogaea]
MVEPVPSNMRDNGVDAVSEVNPTKLSWSLVVGVVRLYEMQNQWNPAEVYNVEVVLQDERGDRIQCSIPKQNIAVFKTLIWEHGLYSMKNFIVKDWGKGVRTCDYISYVVGKEDVTNMVTKSERECKLLAVYLENLQKNLLKCTLFGDLVDKVEIFLDKADDQPLVMMTQLFKPHLYLNEINIQNSFHVSRIYINPDFPNVVIFKDSLMKEGDLCSQGITHIQSQPPHSVSDEIKGDYVKSVEEILNMREEYTCWMVGTIVSIEHGVRDWCYASCGSCPLKVQIIIWNYKARVMVGKTANERIDGSKDDHGESYPKALNDILEKKFLFKLSISDDKFIIGLHSSHLSSMDTSSVDESILSSLATGGQIGTDSGVNSASVVCLSKYPYAFAVNQVVVVCPLILSMPGSKSWPKAEN